MKAVNLTLIVISTRTVLTENFWGGRGHWEVSAVERQKVQLLNNSRTTCIAEPKQSLHEENSRTIMTLSSQSWGLGENWGRPPPAPAYNRACISSSSSKDAAQTDRFTELITMSV